ncbi:hypothetical protein ACWC2K_02330 [Streptomyces chattanoogensis]|uniref:hypothetical protein n=1 Tax=Streptomyces chattanoogensis TaxID=66876 RepID=UPI0036886210
MRLRTTLFAVTLASAALLGSAGAAAADDRSGPASDHGSSGPGGAPMGGESDRPDRQGLLGGDSSTAHGVRDNYPVSVVGRLLGM